MPLTAAGGAETWSVCPPGAGARGAALGAENPDDISPENLMMSALPEEFGENFKEQNLHTHRTGAQPGGRQGSYS